MEAEEISPELTRFHTLVAELEKRVKLVDAPPSADLAQECLALAASFPRNWDFGNAIHYANLLLGSDALSTNYTPLSVDYLLRAGHTHGSPQLDSFGPDFGLANALLALDQRDGVLEYLQLVRIFWRGDFGAINTWRELIVAGEKPTLSRADVVLHFAQRMLKDREGDHPTDPR